MPATKRWAVRSLCSESVREPENRQMTIMEARPSTNEDAAHTITLRASASNPAISPTTPSTVIHASLDLRDTADKVELAKDIGAMQVLGGYILIGVDDNAVRTGELDGADLRAFDEASLTQAMLRYLTGPLQLRTRVAEIAGHTVVVISVGPHPAGCAFFRADGNYTESGGTTPRSARGMSSSGMEREARG